MIIVLTPFIMSCCTSVDVVKVKPIKIINVISDSVYLSSQTSNFIYHNGKYYLSDYYMGIITFDDSFSNYKVSVANNYLPQYPQCYMFAVNNEGAVCLYNSANQSFLYIDKDNVDSCDAANGKYEISLPSRFAFSGDSIICPIIKNKMTGVVFNRGQYLSTCFPTIPGLDNIRLPYHSDRIIVRDKNNFYVICKGLPVLQMFSSDLKFVSSYDLNSIEQIAKTLIQEKSDKPNSYFVVVSDAYAANNMLYLLVASKDDRKYKCNNVLKFVVSDNEIKLEGFYELQGKIYSTLCVNGEGQLVVVNSKTASCEVYEF